ncbi:MAG: transposase [Thermoplasmata archaeon]|nr:transposase [Thermoplasmata archaeon]
MPNLWAFVSKGVTLYKTAYSRGYEVPLKILGKKHKGVNIHDRFSAYKTLADKTKNIQQDCWVHIIKNAEELTHFYGSEGEYILQVLRETYRIGKDFNHQGTDRDIKDLFKWMKDQLNRPYRSHKCNTFVCNLLKEKDNLFEFIKNPDVDRTNNVAERALRPVVIARKVSGGSRSEKGAKNYEILMSVVQTLHQNGRNLVEHGPEILLTSYG